MWNSRNTFVRDGWLSRSHWWPIEELGSTRQKAINRMASPWWKCKGGNTTFGTSNLSLCDLLVAIILSFSRPHDWLSISSQPLKWEKCQLGSYMKAWGSETLLLSHLTSSVGDVSSEVRGQPRLWFGYDLYRKGLCVGTLVWWGKGGNV